jgi:hypothetical protein
MVAVEVIEGQAEGSRTFCDVSANYITPDVMCKTEDETRLS